MSSLPAQSSGSNRSLEGKTGIITGASRGIGAAIAENLASKGCNLLLCYSAITSSPAVEKIAEFLLNTYNIKVHTKQADLANPHETVSIVENTRTWFDRKEINIIINNAGISNNAPIEDVTAEDFHKQYAINVLSPLLLVQAALPYLPHDRSGRIINVSSVSSSLGFKTQSVYGGTKAALEAMTRTWARELAERVTVNAINPGPVDTAMYDAANEEFVEQLRPFAQQAPLMAVRAEDEANIEKRAVIEGGRRATTKEIAGIVGMLVSEESAWCTGSVICANGGLRMSI
ncbi:MAG: hypothetical protein M1824_005755 [Vezdaea acicularis]|nr:MAG: hypothetical protein M1824_005755 [Vezdaea acicularis]